MSGAQKLKTADILYWLEGEDFHSLLKAISDPTLDDKSRGRAASAVIRKGDVRDGNEALKILRDPSLLGRDRLMWVAYKLEAQELVAFAREAIKNDADDDVQATAAIVLSEAGVPPEEWVLDGLTSGSFGAHIAACIAIAEDGLKGYCEPLKSLVHDEHFLVRTSAARAIAKTGCRECADEVMGLMASRNKKEFLLAAISAAELGFAPVALQRIEDSQMSWGRKKVARWAIRRTEKKLARLAGETS